MCLIPITRIRTLIKLSSKRIQPNIKMFLIHERFRRTFPRASCLSTWARSISVLSSPCSTWIILCSETCSKEQRRKLGLSIKELYWFLVRFPTLSCCGLALAESILANQGPVIAGQTWMIIGRSMEICSVSLLRLAEVLSALQQLPCAQKFYRAVMIDQSCL